MPMLHLGVIDVPYVAAPSKRQKQPRASTVTTGDVAEWLEDRYGVFEHYYEQHGGEIVGALENSLLGALESLAMGAPAKLDPFGGATSKIEDGFKNFIATAEMDRLGVAGVPTQAAIDRASGKRRSSRFKTRRATGSPVSFYDTGLYQASARAWVD